MKVLVEAAKRDSFWRCGIQFTKEPKELVVGEKADKENNIITKDQLKIIQKETMLIVRMPEQERNELKDEIIAEYKEEVKDEIIAEYKEEVKNNEDNNEEEVKEEAKPKRQRTTKKDK